MKKNNYSFFVFLFSLILWACSTEKNAFLNRTYHGMTAKYNGYFNANELLTQSIGSFEKNKKDDFYELLKIQAIPNKEESKAMYPAIDTAIVKCTKVIQNHSMPSALSTKEVEYNQWIDENWMTIGKSFFYRGEYDKAQKNFRFVKQFFAKDPAKYEAELWMAKVLIQQGNLTEAIALLDELQQVALDQKQKTFSDIFSVFKKKSSDDDIAVPIDRKIQLEVFKIRADVYMSKELYSDAIFSLSNATMRSKNKREKARINFILGQLYLRQNVLDSAERAFKQAISSSAAFDISFNARLNLAILGANQKGERALNKLLKDAKNAPFKDQIYYAFAQMEQNRGNTPLCKSYLTLSAFYSTSNKRQKAMAYEKSGDIYFLEKNYVPSQKYYDSCSKFMPENYPNSELITSKALKLSQLVISLETAQFEDSVQRVAKMPEKEQTAFLKNVIKQMQADEKLRKEREAEKLRALQNQVNQNSANSSGSNWVFNNQKLKEAGFTEFRKQWGDRKNEDDWRRSVKLSFSQEDPNEVLDSSKQVDQLVINDTLSVESLRKKLPLSDTAYVASILKEIEARYTAGLLYKELLNESDLSQQQFLMVLDKNTRNITDLSSAFQLYKLNELNSEKSKGFKKHIIDFYPNSDLANYFKDPDFFEKIKQNKVKSEEAYLKVLHVYEMLDYNKVITQTDLVITTDLTNAYHAEYMLLNAMAYGQVFNDNELLSGRFQQIIEKHPGTAQAKTAKEYIDLIKKGTSKFEPYLPKTNGIFNFNDTITQFVFILLDPEEDVNSLKSTIANFASKHYKKTKLKVTSVLTLKETPMVMLTEFTNAFNAQDFINTYKSSFDKIGEYQNNVIQIITQENLKKLIESDNFVGYKDFYDLNY